MRRKNPIAQAFNRLKNDGLFEYILLDHPTDCLYHVQRRLRDCDCGRWLDVVTVAGFMEELDEAPDTEHKFGRDY